MSDSSRRGFLKVASASGAAVGVGALVSGALSSPAQAADENLPANAADTIVVHVTNTRTGELTLMSGEHSVAIKDRALAAQIASALHRNSPRSVNSADAR